MGENWGKVKIPKSCYILIYKYFISIYPLPHRELKLTKKNPTGIKTPNGVPLGSFSYTLAQKARCPKNNWQPTEDCEGETYHYVRLVLGYYLTYKQHPELIGKTAAPAPSAVAHRQGRI